MNKLPISYKLSSVVANFGFTLIELLVVISIIGILSAIGISSFTQSQKQARDVQRKSDLKQYQTALENFAGANGGLYPAPVGAVDMKLVDLCNAVLLPGNYASSCPDDPKPESWGRSYHYWAKTTSSTLGDPINQGYAIYVWGAIESDGTKTFVLCSTGTAGTTPNSPNGVRSICKAVQ